MKNDVYVISKSANIYGAAVSQIHTTLPLPLPHTGFPCFVLSFG
jgi:hypothetical protein